MKQFFKETGKLVLLELGTFIATLALLFLHLPWDRNACNSWNWFCLPPTMFWPMFLVSIYCVIHFLFLVKYLLLRK